MKKRTVMMLLCAAAVMGLIGCNGKQQEEKSKKSAQAVTKQTVSEDKQLSEEEKKSQETAKPEQEKEPETSEAVKQEEQQTSGEKQASETKQGSEVKATSAQTTAPPVSTAEPPKASQPMSEIPRATASDSRAVADKVLEYINSYRSEPAIKLPGLTQYAEYRSRQLIGNFAHDTTDERAAATALEYGTYIDPPLYGMTGEAYYTSGAREAIAKGGYVGTVDEVAQRIATLVRNSAGHWAYVGSSEYPYIAVGVTYESGMWYCDIAMARENTDNK